MKPIENIESIKSSEIMQNFNLKSFLIGIVVGMLLIGSFSYVYVNAHYVQVHETNSAGLFVFKNGDLFSLEPVMNETTYNTNFKKVK